MSGKVLRIVIAAADDKNVVLVERGGIFYQVRFVWPWDEEKLESGTMQVFPYAPTTTATSEDVAWKWGVWDTDLLYDADEMPPPPELVEVVAAAFAGYDSGKGYQP